MTLKLNAVRAVVEIHVHATYNQRFISYRVHKYFFALSRNGEKSENPVL